MKSKFINMIPCIITIIDLYIKKYFRPYSFHKIILSFRPLAFSPFNNHNIGLSLYTVKNPGVGFSLLDHSAFKPYLIYLISIILIVLIYEWLKIQDLKEKTAFSLIIGGGIANLIDRYQYGYVLDYLSIDCYQSIVCNFADIAVFLGGIYIIKNIVCTISRWIKAEWR